MRERTPTNSELLALDPATLAMVLFIDASDEFSASQLHIGARIALECKKLDDYSPRELRKALVDRPDLISKLTRLASARHKNNEKAPKNPKAPSMTNLTFLVFGHAQDFMIVPPEELNKFLLTYIPHNNPANFALMDTADAMVEKHKPKSEWRMRNGRMMRPYVPKQT